MQPVIKWSGSKRSQAAELLKYFPSQIDTYYEPFCGGCSVLRRLLDSDIKTKRYVCIDNNPDLISLFEKIKSHPQQVASHYATLWAEMNIDEDRSRKREFFYKIRQRYNEKHNPLDFMFIMRTTTNGMPRYNQKGEFNNSFHITRNGIAPKTLENIINEWHDVLTINNVVFKSGDFTIVDSEKGDFLYLDPPYANTKGMYYNNFDNQRLWEWMRKQKGEYILSYDGISGEVNNTYNVPGDLYSRHLYIVSGNSSFKRTIGKSRDSIVRESLYVR